MPLPTAETLLCSTAAPPHILGKETVLPHNSIQPLNVNKTKDFALLQKVGRQLKSRILRSVLDYARLGKAFLS